MLVIVKWSFKILENWLNFCEIFIKILTGWRLETIPMNWHFVTGLEIGISDIRGIILHGMAGTACVVIKCWISEIELHIFHQLFWFSLSLFVNYIFSHFTSLFSENLLYLTFCWLISNIWDNVRYRRRHPVHWCHAFHWYQTTPPFCFLGRGKMKYFSKSQKGIAQT